MLHNMLVRKLTELGAKVVTLSDSSGFIYDSDGIDVDKLALLCILKMSKEEGLKNIDKYM